MTDYRIGACRDVDPETFFPPGTATENGPWVDRALAVCHSCPISEECMQDHIDLPYGIVGGTTPGQRAKLRLRLPQLIGARR